MTRAFVAVDLDDAARDDALGALELLSRAKGAPPDARWVSKDSMHVTLKFLGSVSEEAIARLSAELDALAARPAPALVIGALAAFPEPGHARVVILDVEDGGALASLAARLEDLAEREGVAREARAYHPHLTLARLGRPRDARAWLASRPHEPRPTRAVAITLYESVTAPSGARYTPLARASFAP